MVKMVIIMTFSDGESEDNDDDNVFDKEISFFQAYHIFFLIKPIVIKAKTKPTCNNKKIYTYIYF